MFPFILILFSLMKINVAHPTTYAIEANPTLSGLEPVSLDEILKGNFRSKVWNGTWISDNVFIIKTEDGDINKVNAADLKQETFLKADLFSDYKGSSITISTDQKYVLIRYNEKSIFRHSKTAQYAIYDIENKLYHHVASKKHIQYARWAPVDSALVYVEDNNIYYLPIPKPENTLTAIAITTDGASGVFYNGVPDWVYEEEVLASGHALWFSPDGKRLAFASFNDDKVNEFDYYMYGEPGEIKNQYPTIVKLKYPKVGTSNPKVAVKYVAFENLENIVTLDGIIPKDIVSADHVLTGVVWATNNVVVAVSQNRVQNSTAITRCDVTTNTCNVETTVAEKKGWLEIKPPVYNKQGTKSILLLAQQEQGDMFKHLVLFDIETKQSKRLTFGKRVILSVQKWDEDNNLVYYTSTVEGTPSLQHVYAVNVDTLKDVCLTCSFNTPEAMCKVAAIYLSEKSSYGAKVCNGPGPALIHIENLKTQESLLWENNQELRIQLSKKLRPIIKDINVPLENGFNARARLWLPPDFDGSAKVQYPMIVDVYAGPGSNRITDAFNIGVLHYFTTTRKYIYAQIDGRGSGRNGNNLMFQMYRKMGTVEIEDQIAVTKYLKRHYPFIDGEKIGIWGWSYGGFATIWTLIKDVENIFKFGLSVAPVTNFIYYDTIYTERYMGLSTEEDNIVGYRSTDASKHVESLRNKTLFLIHGNADDNVHYQQSMLFAKALEKADIMFYQQSYPDENHSLSGVLPHLYHTIDRFFSQGFK